MGAIQYLDSAYQKEITMNAGDIIEAFTDQAFPYNLNDADLTNAFRADGLDIVFTKADGTLLDRVIIDFVRAAPTGTAWIKFPAGSPASGGTPIYMQWGGPSVNVANSASTFADHVLATVLDASGDDYSSNANNGTLHGTVGTPSSVAAQIGNGLDFNRADNQYIDYGDQNYYSFGDGLSDNPFTFLGWINMDDATDFRIFYKESEYQHECNGADRFITQIFDGGAGTRRARYEFNARTADEGSWILISFTYDGSTPLAGQDVLRNGVVIDDTTNQAGVYTAMHNLGFSLLVGRKAASYADGKMNALRIFNLQLSTNRILTQYNIESKFSTNGGFTTGSLVLMKNSYFKYW